MKWHQWSVKWDQHISLPVANTPGHRIRLAVSTVSLHCPQSLQELCVIYQVLSLCTPECDITVWSERAPSSISCAIPLLTAKHIEKSRLLWALLSCEILTHFHHLLSPVLYRWLHVSWQVEVLVRSLMSCISYLLSVWQTGELLQGVEIKPRLGLFCYKTA